MNIIKDKYGYLYAKENLGKSKKHSTNCDIAITPLHPDTNKKITKKELYGKNSNQAVIFHIYAKSETEALELLFPKLVEETIMPDMLAAGILTMPDSPDLRALFAIHKDKIMEYCRSQSKRPWQEATVSGYYGQYDLMLNDLADIYPEDLTTDLYCYVQGRICQAAAKSSHDKEAWVQYGDEAPKSAQKRLNFFYHGLMYLGLQNLIELPIVPFKYNGAPSRESELKQLLGNPRSYPFAVQQKFLDKFEDDVLICLIAACGTRTSETAGLLGCSILPIDTSQGTMYYLSIFGQLDSRGKYKEYGKSSAAYRCIPVPRELARTVMDKLDATKGSTGNEIHTILLSMLLSDIYDKNDPKLALEIKESTETAISSFLRQPDVQKQLYQQLPFLYDESVQRESLETGSTVHSLRRSYWTWLHCFSGFDYDQIFYQMGHSQGKEAGSCPRGKSHEELQRMCLQEFVSNSMFHTQNPLHYRVDSSCDKMDVPACKLILDIPAGWSGDIIISSTEPVNDIQAVPSQPQNISTEFQSVSVPYPMTDALLAAEKATEIVKSEPAFE